MWHFLGRSLQIYHFLCSTTTDYTVCFFQETDATVKAKRPKLGKEMAVHFCKYASVATEKMNLVQELRYNSMENGVMAIVIQNLDEKCEPVLIIVRKTEEKRVEREYCRHILLIFDGLDECEKKIFTQNTVEENIMSFVHTIGLPHGSKDYNSLDRSVWSYVMNIFSCVYVDTDLNQTAMEFPLKLTPNSFSHHTLQEYLAAFFVHNMDVRNWKNENEMVNNIR